MVDVVSRSTLPTNASTAREAIEENAAKFAFSVGPSFDPTKAANAVLTLQSPLEERPQIGDAVVHGSVLDESGAPIADIAGIGLTVDEVVTQILQTQYRVGYEATPPTMPFNFDREAPVVSDFVDNGDGTLSLTVTQAVLRLGKPEFGNQGHGEWSYTSHTYTLNDVRPAYSANNAATFSGDLTGSVTKDLNETLLGHLETFGQLQVFDPDAGEAVFIEEELHDPATNLGVLDVAADGSWVYTVKNADVQHLAAGQTRYDVFTVRSADGTTQTVTIAIKTPNPVLTLQLQPNGTYPNYINTSSKLEILDENGVAVAFKPQIGRGNGTTNVGIGYFSIDQKGNMTFWSDQGAWTKRLRVGEIRERKVTVETVDGVKVTVTLQLVGANDAATFGGDISGTVTEDMGVVEKPDGSRKLVASGTATVHDVDGADEKAFIAETLQGTYGNLTIAADGNWTYNADNSLPEIQALNEGETLEESFTVKSIDGTKRDITVTIYGADDAGTAGNNSIDGETDAEILTDYLGEVDYNNVFELLALMPVDTDGNIQPVAISDAGMLSYMTGSSGLAGLTGLPEWSAFLSDQFDPETGQLLSQLHEIDVGVFESLFLPEDWEVASQGFEALLREAMVLSNNWSDLVGRATTAASNGDTFVLDGNTFDDIARENLHDQATRNVLMALELSGPPPGVQVFDAVRSGTLLEKALRSPSLSQTIRSVNASGRTIANGMAQTAEYLAGGVAAAAEPFVAIGAGVTAVTGTVATYLAFVGAAHGYAGKLLWDAGKELEFGDNILDINRNNKLSIGAPVNLADVATILKSRLEAREDLNGAAAPGLSPFEAQQALELTAILRIMLNGDNGVSDTGAALDLIDQWYSDGVSRAVIETALAGTNFDGGTLGLTQQELLALSNEAIARTGGATNYWSYLQNNEEAHFSIATETFFIADPHRKGVFNGMTATLPPGLGGRVHDHDPLKDSALNVAAALNGADPALMAGLFGSWEVAINPNGPNYLSNAAKLLAHTLEVMYHGPQALTSATPNNNIWVNRSIPGLVEWAKTDHHGFDAMLVRSAEPSSIGLIGGLMLNSLSPEDAYTRISNIIGAFISADEIIGILEDPASSLNKVFKNMTPEAQDGLRHYARTLTFGALMTAQDRADYLAPLPVDEQYLLIEALDPREVPSLLGTMLNDPYSMMTESGFYEIIEQIMVKEGVGEEFYIDTARAVYDQNADLDPRLIDMMLRQGVDPAHFGVVATEMARQGFVKVLIGKLKEKGYDVDATDFLPGSDPARVANLYAAMTDLSPEDIANGLSGFLQGYLSVSDRIDDPENGLTSEEMNDYFGGLLDQFMDQDGGGDNAAGNAIDEVVPEGLNLEVYDLIEEIRRSLQFPRDGDRWPNDDNPFNAITDPFLRESILNQVQDLHAFEIRDRLREVLAMDGGQNVDAITRIVDDFLALSPETVASLLREGAPDFTKTYYQLLAGENIPGQVSGESLLDMPALMSGLCLLT